MTTHETYMQIALEAAREAARLGEIPVGACIVQGGGRISAMRVNTRQTQRDPLGHAEINAIRQACQQLGSWRLDGRVLYVTLEACPMCAGPFSMPALAGWCMGQPTPKPAVWVRCAISQPCRSLRFPTIKVACWRRNAGRYWTSFSGNCGKKGNKWPEKDKIV